MPWLLGDSFGQLGQEALAEEQNRRLAFGQAMGAFQQGAAQAARRREIAQELGLRERMINEEKVRWAQEFKARQDEIARQIANDKMRNLNAQGWLEEAKATGVWQRGQKTPAQVRADDYAVGQVDKLSQAGHFDSVDEVARALPPDYRHMAPIFFQQNEQADQQMSQQHRWASMHAGVVNKYLDITDQLNQAKEARKGMGMGAGWTKKGAQLDSVIDSLTKQQQSLLPAYQQSLNTIKSPHAANLFAPDPDTGRVASLVPPTPRMQRQAMINFAAGFGEMGQPTDTGTTPSPMRVAPGLAPAPTRATSTRYQPQHDDWVYQRAQQHVDTGLDKANAMQQALDEYDIRQRGQALQLDVLP